MAANNTPFAEASSSKPGLSTEQLIRMEENRRRAREKLARRNLGEQPKRSVFPPPSSSLPAPPPRPQPLLQLHDTNSAGFRDRNSQPPQDKTILSRPIISPKCFRGNNTNTAVVINNKSSITNSAKGAAVASSKKLNVVELVRPTVKANLRLVSRERFEVVVPYDRQTIEVFKKTPTNSYHAGRSMWSFDIKMYDKLGALQRECRHLELSQIPRSVVSLFQTPPPPPVPVGGASEGWSGVASNLNSTLMQFQREGINYCIQRQGRALLADDMGLGKTLQALAVMSHYRSNWPLLIICPSSVKMTWAEACKRWIPSLSEEEVVVIATGKLSSSSTPPPPVTIISYDLATRLGSELAHRKPAAIIVDESHFLKNFKTNRCKAILPLIKSATRCLLLSGTPALSRPIELYTQISSLDKSFRISQTIFGIRYCSGVKGRFGWDFSGASNLTELHLYMQTKFMIRRLKTDVLDQLPSKRRQTMLLDVDRGVDITEDEEECGEVEEDKEEEYFIPKSKRQRPPK